VISVFFASLIHVLLRALQQLNVQHDKKLWVPVVSMGMAFTEIYVLVKNTTGGFEPPVVIVTGLGAGIGCLAAMELHKKLRGRCK
jgi:hypothetical protein